jgi:uncharacterized Fe-S cluster-containing radical SAM superfamily protein
MSAAVSAPVGLDPRKFRNPDVTAKGETRASVTLGRLRTLWFNTGTLCNLTCVNCYIESSPTNDRLVYLSFAEVTRYLDEIRDAALPVEEIGITGGEPFMNPDIIPIMEACLSRGFRVLMLTNAMRPMMKLTQPLDDLRARYGRLLTMRVSIDHYTQALHETERGKHSWGSAILGLKWLADREFRIAVAGRTFWKESEASLRGGYARLFAERGISLDANDPMQLVLFPEMDLNADVPEITTACWGILKKDPNSLMCASSRMIVKRKGASEPVVLPCTLLPYDTQFELGPRLADAKGPVKLNHPHCAKFCVLGGGSCGVG